VTVPKGFCALPAQPRIPQGCGGDAFFAFIDEGYVAPRATEAGRQNEIVIEAAGASAGRLVSGGYTVVYDGVIGPWFLDTLGTAASSPDCCTRCCSRPSRLASIGSAPGSGTASPTRTPLATCIASSPRRISTIGTSCGALGRP